MDKCCRDSVPFYFVGYGSLRWFNNEQNKRKRLAVFCKFYCKYPFVQYLKLIDFYENKLSSIWFREIKIEFRSTRYTWKFFLLLFQTIKYALTCYGSKLLCGVFTILTSYIMQLMAICHCLSTRYAEKNNGNSGEMSNKKHCVYVFILFDPNDQSLESEYINTLDIVRCHMALILSLNLGMYLSYSWSILVVWKT